MIDGRSYSSQLGEEVRPHAVGAESVNAEHGERELPSTRMPDRPERRQTPACNEVIEGPRPERDVLRNFKIIFCKAVLHRKKMTERPEERESVCVCACALTLADTKFQRLPLTSVCKIYS